MIGGYPGSCYPAYDGAFESLGPTGLGAASWATEAEGLGRVLYKIPVTTPGGGGGLRVSRFRQVRLPVTCVGRGQATWDTQAIGVGRIFASMDRVLTQSQQLTEVLEALDQLDQLSQVLRVLGALEQL